MRSVVQSRMNIAQGSEQGTCPPSAVRSLAPRKTCPFKAFQCFFSRHLLLRISLLRRKRKNDGHGQSQSPPLKGLKLGGCPSITLSEKVALRPFMSELCLVLCGPFLDMLEITENVIWENVNYVVRQIPKTLLTLLSPATPEGRNTKEKHIQIEEYIKMRLSRVTRKTKGGKNRKRTTRGAKHGENTIRADRYVDNSPLRSE